MQAVSSIFDIRYGHSLELNALEQTSPKEGVAFVSRQKGSNGISAYVTPLADVDPAPAGEVTCALSGNGVLTTCLQEAPFYTGFHVAILKAKVALTKQQILYYCACIRQNRYRYSYGRQANKTLAKLLIPSPSEIPSWVSSTDLDQIKDAGKPALAVQPPTIDPQKWKEFRYDALFDIKKGNRLTKGDMTAGNTPFIGAIDSNNGYRQFISASPNHSAGTITVAYNGNGVAEAFYQDAPFRASDDVNVLYPKFDINKYVALFICALIRQEKFRFNYGRKWHLARMKEAIIRLPITPSGDPDWAFIEGYIKSLPYSMSIKAA
ncbi:S-CspCI protein [Mesorhizobium sp. M2A.F.Ca.ET.037.01.1.1]|uniref:restriction endonuclease subunit S n=1 Tax=Mesorhizobium sp. M2A.F.Ca.ET.037.01.1.1 TaxID=2496748 RepID=UPI000FCB7637|nr:restriction endonuclease subunit S [Mesorhizobium sp. M2A.F.Ca.ET.037.01.1.1]RUX20518.1 S-CspCI protein [Mesorhizobium sp. M2A.F.Ca.ET.037.01.1.1]